MRQYTISDIIDFVEKETSSREVTPDTDIFYDLDCVEDDFGDLMEKYSEKFGVDLANYIWFFHCDEEGQNFGGMFFKPPYARVDRIPLTPKILLLYANTGIWNMTYPRHRIPRKRLDILINKIIVGLFLVFLLYYFLR
ncbi:MAG: DUF1493 family protein [Chitinophagaceae bacterium]|nr:DUF1493 family protein [Chitinophagaceae bacterium]